MKNNIQLKEMMQLMGDRGFYCEGKINSIKFKAHLQPEGWIPRLWTISYFRSEDETIEQAVLTAELQREVLDYLNNEHYPPTHIDEYEKLRRS